MKNYYVRCELDEEMPDYVFVVKAEKQDEADELALMELLTSYPMYKERIEDGHFSVYEITPEELLERLTIN